LLLLRVSASAALLWSGWSRWTAWQEPKALTLVVWALALASGVLLLFGYLTSLTGAIGLMVSLGDALAFLPGPQVNGTAGRIAAAFTIVITFAICCLGPGAYSLDARRHGRREIIIPARH
jgi:uncharacterized membrane protein YphA (DoxX/SURF4 family)